MRRPGPTDALTHRADPLQDHGLPYKNEFPSFNPFQSLLDALGYGQAIWTKVTSLPPPDALQLMDLTFLIDEHIQNLLTLCNLDYPVSSFTNGRIISDLQNFYNRSELFIRPNKRGSSLREILLQRAELQSTNSNNQYTNYYDLLEEVHDEYITSESHALPFTQIMEKQPKPVTQTSFPEDLAISEVTTSIRHRQTVMSMVDDDEDNTDNPNSTPLPNTPPRMTTITTTEAPSPMRLRINLIRHKYATSTDKTALQLFQSFVHAARKTDPTFIVLPIDSTKQQLSSLTSTKQVDSLSTNQLRLYFSSWFRDQPHSLSGFLHVQTKLSVEEMVNSFPLAEWFVTYQYSVKLCRSQEEEMSIIGALCYGSLFIHRDSLLESIQSLLEWIKLNQGRETPIVIGLVVKPFRSPGKSADMIFIRSERSKKEEATNFFLKLYDGTPKRYPRGDMFFFIPVTSKLEVEYSDAQRTKFLFNHQAYLGDEDCFVIFGLSDLETNVTLKDGKMVTIRTLLKSLPASAGMARPRLFQVVDFVPSQNCVLVTFQRSDRALVEDRQLELEVELSDQLTPGDASKLFVDETQGLRFGQAYHKNKGKVIRIHNPSQTHRDFVQYADRLLSSPPKKRTNAEMTMENTQKQRQANAANISYSGIVQAHMTHTRSVAAPNGVTTTTTTQTSQTVTAVMETRFRNIEHEQQALSNRLYRVENRTVTTDENIRAMMAHWNINPASSKRKFIENGVNDENLSSAGNAHLSALADQGQGDQCF